MIRVKCHECRKSYNWEDDCFCPHCGAFNQAKSHGFDRETVATPLRTSKLDKSASTPTSTDSPKPLPDTTSSPKKKRTPLIVQILILIMAWNILLAILSRI